MDYKKDFPIFKNHPKLIYLDSASTSQKPKQVINSITKFYEKENANIHRGIYDLSEKATKRYEQARQIVAKFINAETKEIIFTKNTTESINFLSYTIKDLIPKERVGNSPINSSSYPKGHKGKSQIKEEQKIGDFLTNSSTGNCQIKEKNEIVLTEMEHHSNLIPWQQFAKKYNFKLKFIPITKNYKLNYEKAKQIINNKTAIFAVTHISNVFGTINNIKFLVSLAKEKKAITIIDAAQSVQHLKIDVKKIDCDFLAFSGHKVFGPAGVGVLYGKKNLLEKLPPFQFGGGMINSVSYEEASWADIPKKFEAGTPNIAGAIGLAEAIKYVESTGIEKIKNYEKKLLEYALKKLKTIDGITIYNPGPEKSLSVISFNLRKIHPHDIAGILNDYNLAIRAGHHCCMPLMKKLGINGTCRISLSIYNSKEEIDKLINRLKKIQELFKK